MMKTLLTILMLFQAAFAAATIPFQIEVEQASIPGTPKIHSFAFAQSSGKWLFIGGRINGMHGFTTSTSFPKEFSNTRIYVVDPSSGQTWSRSIFADLPFWVADQLRSMNMQYVQDGNRLIFLGGYGYDSTANNLISFPLVKAIDISETIDAVINGTSIAPYVRELNDARFQVTGGELTKLGDHFFLVGGHKFMGPYRRNINNQTYTRKICKFRINDDGTSITVSDYSEWIDSVEYHRRDMNLVPAISPDGTSEYAILYGGVFKIGVDLPYVNPIYINENSAIVDFSYEQKMSQYTCAYMSIFNIRDGSMHTTMFAGMSLYTYNETNSTLEYDSLVPFINDITTITRRQDGSSYETIAPVRFDSLIGSNAKFILNPALPAYPNGVIKLNELNGRTFAGYVFGGIKGRVPNGGPSAASDLIYRIYVTPDAPLPVELNGFVSNVTGRDVKLSWNTFTESNNYGFTVERTYAAEADNESWQEIGFVEGSGSSGEAVYYEYIDRNLGTGRYLYRLKQTDFNGNYEYFKLANEVAVGIPLVFSLHQNYPNPFNPSTRLNFDIPADGTVSLKLYDIRGAEVAKLAHGVYTAGYHGAELGASVTSGLSSGVYYAVLNYIPASGGEALTSSVSVALVK